ncbi:MAG: hypothetical protein PUC36_04035 [Clostridiales bacterium]|nr:hypothetical protein [Clostridiales bacterium]
MKKDYKDLNALLAAEPKAAALFAQIPQYARDQIMSRADNVASMDALEAYVHNVLRGDG